MTNPSIQVERVTVQDPFEPDKTTTVQRNLKTDPIEYLFARERIDNAQYQAANKFMRLWEVAQSLGAKAGWHKIEEYQRLGCFPDTSGPRTDVHGSRERAQAEFNRAAQCLDRPGLAIVMAICGERHTIQDVARAFYDESRASQDYVSRRLKEHLTELADHWNINPPAIGRSRRPR